VKKLFLIDFDGTIADTKKVFWELAYAECERRGVTLPPQRELETLHARDIIKFANTRWWQLPFVIHRLRRGLVKQLPSCRAFTGMQAAITNLRKQGPVLVVTSADGSGVRAFLRQHNIIVDGVSAGISVFGKARRIKHLLLTRKAHAENTVYIGDELRDNDAARDAGVHIALVTWGYTRSSALRAAKPDWIITKPHELKKISAI